MIIDDAIFMPLTIDFNDINLRACVVSSGAH